MRQYAPRPPSAYAPSPNWPLQKALPRAHFPTRRRMATPRPIAAVHVPLPVHPLLRADSCASSVKRRTTATITAYQRTELYSQPPQQKVTIPSLNENGDPFGRKELGRKVVKWVAQGMRKMAVDFAASDSQFDELLTRVHPFVVHAQGYLNAVPMPLGYESVCLKIRTHYPTLFDHFQRELKDVLQKQSGDTWQAAVSWRLLKHLANSPQHRAIARKTIAQPSDFKIRKIQSRVEEFTRAMEEMLRVERDAELEFTQEELNAVSDS